MSEFKQRGKTVNEITGTFKNLYIQWELYFLFSAYFNFQDLPAEINTLCLYVQFVSRSFKSIQSVRNYLSGVKTLHANLDIDFPKDNIFSIKFLRGISREKPHIPRQAEPITPVILLDIYKHLNLLKQTDAVFWCIVLLMFFFSYDKKVQRNSKFCERF